MHIVVLNQFLITSSYFYFIYILPIHVCLHYNFCYYDLFIFILNGIKCTLKICLLVEGVPFYLSLFVIIIHFALY